MVDWVLPVQTMPARISEYYASEARLKLPAEEGPQPAKPIESPPDQSETVLREVLAFLRTRTGRDFSYYKRATIVRRISRRMQVVGTEDLTGYLSHLRTHPGEAGALLQDLLISVTNFFRDREAFNAIEAQLPDLFRNKKSSDTVRIWCAACATGEEAYSMAMLLLEYARRMEAPPMLQVFGCDLDEEAIQVARAGFYPDTIVADVNEERLRRFFVKEPGGYRVRRELREMVLFAAHDLLKDAPFSRMDLISCRNLLIYLNRDAQARVLEIFNFALKFGGLLFLGSSESVEEGSALFAPIDKKHRIYRHRTVQRMGLPVPTGAGEGAIQRVLQQHERLKTTHAGLPGRAFVASYLPPQAENALVENSLPANELHFKLLGRFGPASLVVNEQHEIIHLSENANRFLQLPEGEPTRNLLRLVHPMLRVELRAALLRAAESNQPVEIFRRLVDLPGGTKAVDLKVSPASDVAAGYLLVLFEAHEPSAEDGAEAHVVRDTLEPTAVVQQRTRTESRQHQPPRHRRTIRGLHRGIEGQQRRAAGNERRVAQRRRRTRNRSRGIAERERRTHHREFRVQEPCRRTCARQLRPAQPDERDANRDGLSRPRIADHALYALGRAAVQFDPQRRGPANRTPQTSARLSGDGRGRRTGFAHARAARARNARRWPLVSRACAALSYGRRSYCRRGAQLCRHHRAQTRRAGVESSQRGIRTFQQGRGRTGASHDRVEKRDQRACQAARPVSALRNSQSGTTRDYRL